MFAFRWACGCIAFVAVVVLGYSFNAVANEHGLLQLIVEGVQESESRLRNYQATYRYEHEWNEEARRKYMSQAERDSLYPQARVTDRADLTWEMGKFSMRQAVTFDNGLLEHIVSVYDGRFQKRYRPEHETGLVQSTNNLPVLEGPYEFINQSFRHVKNMCLSEYLQKSTVEKIETLGEGNQQMFLLHVKDVAGTEEVPIKARIHIDPTRGYALRKVELMRPDLSAEPRIILEVEEFKEVSPGVFFPMKGRKDVFQGGRGEPVMKMSSCRTVVEKVAVNLDLPLNAFQFEFPDGTEVYDEFLATAYTVGTTRQHLDAVEQHLETLASSSENESRGGAVIAPVASESGQPIGETIPTNDAAHPEPSPQAPSGVVGLGEHSSLWLTVIAVGIAAVLVTTVTLRRRKWRP